MRQDTSAAQQVGQPGDCKADHGAAAEKSTAADNPNAGPHRLQAGMPTLRWGAGLAACCLGMIFGIALQLQQRELDAPLRYAALTAAGLLTMMACLRLQRRRDFGIGLAFAAFLLASALVGAGSTGWRATAFQASALDPALEGRDIAVTGIVLAMPQRSDDALRFRFGVESARLDDKPVALPPQIQLGWYAGFAAREAEPSRKSFDTLRVPRPKLGEGSGRTGDAQRAVLPQAQDELGSEASEHGSDIPHQQGAQDWRAEPSEHGAPSALQGAQIWRGEPSDREGSPAEQGPRDWLRQTAGAAAPPGLEPAAPKLLEQLRTGDRGDASREPRPARPRELHAVSDRRGSMAQSPLILRALISAPKRAPSIAARMLKSLGDMGAGIPPMARMRSFTAWLPRILLISRFSRLTISAGVPVGA